MKLTDSSKVSIVQSEKEQAEQIQEEDIKKMVSLSVEYAGGFKSIIKDGDTVVIKPNLVNMKDSMTGQLLSPELSGVTSDYRVAKTVVELVRAVNPSGKVYIMEGSTESKTKEVFTHFKYTAEFIPKVDEFIAIEEDSGEWQEFNSNKLVKVQLQNGLLHKEYYLNKRYKEADVVISLACLKSHSSAVITGGIKNLSIGATPANIYGASPDDNSRMKMVQHDNIEGDLHKWIHDYYMCRKADFAIIDGIQGFQNGPSPQYQGSINNDLMNMKLIIAGRDAVAVDTVGALIMNWDPASIGYLKFLNESGGGCGDTSLITVIGKQVDEVRKDFAVVKLPPSGGAKISYDTLPAFKVKSIQYSDKNLNLCLEVDKKVVKVVLFIDGRIADDIINCNFESTSINVGNLCKGKHEITIEVFDRFLNRTEQKESITV